MFNVNLHFFHRATQDIKEPREITWRLLPKVELVFHFIILFYSLDEMILCKKSFSELLCI